MIEDGSGTQVEEGFLNATDTTCLEPSGTGSFNRFYQRPDDQPKTISAPWEDCASIGLSEDFNAAITIFPNPSNGVTNIEVPAGKHEVRIYNLTGSVWNAGDLTAGIYVVNVSNESGLTATQKVVLK